MDDKSFLRIFAGMVTVIALFYVALFVIGVLVLIHYGIL